MILMIRELKIKRIFHYPISSMYDVDGNGFIDIVEMTKIVRSIYNMMGPSQVCNKAIENHHLLGFPSEIFQKELTCPLR